MLVRWLLKKAEELTARDGLHYCKKHVQRAAVYQNMANYYKKQKKYQAALQVAEKAVRINDKLALSDRFPIAYFLQACLHGLLQEPAKAGFMYTACLTVAEAQRPSHGGASASDGAQAAEVFHTLKAATLHNLAIEWANLNMPEQTRDALAGAMEVGVHYLPQTHPVVVRILETYKIMRENFLFHNNRSDTAPMAPPPSTTRPNALVRPISPPSLESASKRPLPPSSQKPSHELPGDVTSPRTRRISSREGPYPETEDMTPVPPPTRRPTSPNSAVVISSRARTVKRPTTTPEVPTGLSGQSLPPGATRTSHLWVVPDKIYGHSLGANKAATEIQAQIRRFLCQQEFAKILTASATLNRVLRGMHARTQVRSAIVQVVEGSLGDTVISVIVADLELRTMMTAVEDAIDHIIAMALIEPRAETSDSNEKQTYGATGQAGGTYAKIDESINIRPKINETEQKDRSQTINSLTGEKEQVPCAQILKSAIKPDTFSTQYDKPCAMVKSDSDQAILRAFMSSTIANSVNFAILAAIEDCSNDINNILTSPSDPKHNQINTNTAEPIHKPVCSVDEEADLAVPAVP
ncbi:unnamed protein product [Phytophthora fragariaefolia]|uniref:Unnamed protein product n=1 Tax=Phytophthora fragariaefolia TaxID=1490495 RepID=A0A9W6Y5V7_9STRA|nr:unnamed protein product [Phytophthora fragariaefolia]